MTKYRWLRAYFNGNVSVFAHLWPSKGLIDLRSIVQFFVRVFPCLIISPLRPNSLTDCHDFVRKCSILLYRAIYVYTVLSV